MNTVPVTAKSVNWGYQPVVTKQLTFEVGASIPFIWGAQDAAAGLICVPEMNWVRSDDQAEYAAGWAAINGHNDTTRQFLSGPNGRHILGGNS